MYHTCRHTNKREGDPCGWAPFRTTLCCLTVCLSWCWNWGGWIRTTDLLINSQALCQLSYTPRITSHTGNLTVSKAPRQPFDGGRMSLVPERTHHRVVTGSHYPQPFASTLSIVDTGTPLLRGRLPRHSRSQSASVRPRMRVAVSDAATHRLRTDSTPALRRRYPVKAAAWIYARKSFCSRNRCTIVSRGIHPLRLASAIAIASFV